MELIKVEGFKVAMTSLQVAEITGKQHSHIMRDIRDEISKLGEEIGQSIFGLTSYTDKSNRQSEMYNLSRDGAMQLGARYDATTRYKMIQRINELEQIVGEKERLYLGLFNKDPLVVANSHKALVELETKPLIATIEKQETKIKNLFEQIEDLVEKGRNTTFDIGTAAKLLNYKGLGKTRMFSLLRKQGVLCKNNDPMQKYIDNKYMILVSKPHPYMDEMYKQTRVTVKGLFALGRMLAKWGYESNISEQELIEDIRNLVG
ncbi:MAG: Rha family transcriptional regulator [Cetobacterium sp.]|uniref:Rha family transcriptional regulator n=1 Tax=Cetobacterium sp. TaxID=2071632 RepID=UPI003F2A796C